jgi:hypothetical protein
MGSKYDLLWLLVASSESVKSFPKTSPWHLAPADLAKHFDVRLTGEQGDRRIRTQA